MLRATFCHIENVSTQTEGRLWEAGFVDWQRLKRFRPAFVSADDYSSICSEIEESEARLEARDALYFLARLPGLHKVRVLPDFVDSTVFVDVETTGLSDSDELTTVAVCSNCSLQCFVNGKNLERLLPLLDGSAVLVTYNGANFDLPVLARVLKVKTFPVHLDLCPLLRLIGYRGGLKNCEKLLGIERHCSSGMDGARAARLWNIYAEIHDERALKLLLAYNADDVLSLRLLAERAYRRSMELYPHLGALRYGRVEPPEYDFQWEKLFFDS